MATKEKRPSVVNSVSLAFKRALTPTEDSKEAKLEHRTNLKGLVDDYMGKVAVGKATGIRNAKDLVEVMKMDLLLMGEATERTDNVNTLDEVRVTKVSQAIDLEDPSVQAIIDTIMMAMNGANDAADMNPSKAMVASPPAIEELDDPEPK